MLLVKLGSSRESYEMKPGQSSLELRLRQTVNLLRLRQTVKLLITTAFGDNYCSLDSQTVIIIAKHGVVMVGTGGLREP